MADKVYRSILITGASSGIGEALALAFAGPGICLALGARRRALLESVAERCRAKGASVDLEAIDVTDSAASEAWISASDSRHPLDLLIANAGISGGTYGGPESAEQTRAVFAVNVDGLLNCVLPILPRMRARRAGQIALMSSLAGHRGFPGAPAYSATKAAVKIWGEGLRGALAPCGIGVSVIMPGFVESPMTAVNDFPMPFLMPVEKAAQIIRRGLEANRARIAFPWPMAVLAWAVGAFSPAATEPLLGRLPRKR
jgi:short-subunit dehydrogenase